MIPPAPILNWKDIVSYTFISEFDLLKHAYSRDDVQREAWCDPVNREIAAKYFKVIHAREEITWLNAEIRRLHTWIVDEDIFLAERIKVVQKEDPFLAAELSRYRSYKARVHRSHLMWIREIHKLPGFTGSLESGRRWTTPINSDVQTDTGEHVPNGRDTQTHAIDIRQEGHSALDTLTEIDSNHVDDNHMIDTEEPVNLEYVPAVIPETQVDHDDQLIHDEILAGRTQDDLFADEQLTEDVAQMAEILQETELQSSVAPVRKSQRCRRRLQDVIPGHMLNRIKF